MVWPIGKSPDKETRDRISASRLKQEAEKPKEVRQAQNKKIGESVAATAAKKAEGKPPKQKRGKKS